ncbi:MAG TPA: ABC transporter permease [Chloroflexi bacterium]|nr:ABC transporter permease [Chloroflexota bacterium]
MRLRPGQYLVTILVVLSLNFFLPRMIPGNPLAQLDDPQAMPMPLSAEQRAAVMAYYGLDKPLAAQYGDYLAALARGDLGWSISYRAPVAEVLAGRLRWTLGLVGVSTVLYVALGIALGAISAWRRGSLLDTSLLTLTLGLGSFPSYVLAMLLAVVFAVKLRVLPLGGARSATLLTSAWHVQALDVARHMVLPVAALVLTGVGDVYYLTRSALVQVLGDTYITVARAKGLGEPLLVFRHALPNALLPVVSLVALRLGHMVMGAMMVEVVFAYPGMGAVIVEAGVSRDYPLLQGAFLVTMVSVLGANLLADAVYGVLDPRLRAPA